MDTPKRHRPSEPVLSFNTSFREAYVQTRHKNLRCFPVCSAVHMDKSFCGRIIEVAVSFPRETEPPVGKPMLVGEFRCTTVRQSLDVGSNTENVDFRNPKYIIAELVVSGSRDLRFVINPNRKWFYPRTTSEGELHCYSAFLMMDNVVIAQLDSPTFKVLPIWKEERRPSMLGLPAGPKSVQSSPRGSRTNDEEYESGSSGSSPPRVPTSPTDLAHLAMQYNMMRQQDPSVTMGWPSNMGMGQHPNQATYFRPFQQSGLPQGVIHMMPPFQPAFTPVSSAMPAPQMYQPYFVMPKAAAPPPPPPLMATSNLPHFAPPSHRSLAQRFLVAQQPEMGNSHHARTAADGSPSLNNGTDGVFRSDGGV